jgi:aerobic-type carbon monoxide dehydrogenase small subunit (CoxS/CutS family)
MATVLTINGLKQELAADPARSLLSVLRDDLTLTGCKYGCGEGECGACTVLVGGKAVRSCITPLADCSGKSITTVEGLAANGKLHAVQEAFIDCDAMQCGYCTTGMIMSSVSLLAEKPRPTREEIVEGMNGNICRCGTYSRIIAAIQQASGQGGGK